MKRSVALFFLLSSPAVFAQQGMDPEIMQQLQEMVACVAAIDQNEIISLEKESKKIGAEVKGLCKSGDRDKAQELAMEFGRKVVNNPVFITVRKCTENTSGAMEGMLPDISSTEKMAKDYSDKHVCDEI